MSQKLKNDSLFVKIKSRRWHIFWFVAIVALFGFCVFYYTEPVRPKLLGTQGTIVTVMDMARNADSAEDLRVHLHYAEFLLTRPNVLPSGDEKSLLIAGDEIVKFVDQLRQYQAEGDEQFANVKTALGKMPRLELYSDWKDLGAGALFALAVFLACSWVFWVLGFGEPDIA